ncbi:hemolysin III family protein [Lachnospiraceae bacterium OttesenSCG-928-E19]|nr:hemolysin III family protein [Lachnospiraceae bacterium OttesenSCG-928-E19]
MPKIVRPYTKSEEIMHCAVHGLGIAFAVIGTAILVTLSAMRGDWWALVSCAIFGISMIMLYSASTIYHASRDENRRKILKKMDHISIYYLIAGTYTPFLLVNLRGPLGWSMFAIIWALALLGTFLKLKSHGTSGTKVWSIALYLAMGWLMIFASGALIQNISRVGLLFLALGGIFYTAGIVFYVWKSKKYTHAIWHAFVLVGTIMHFLAILYGVVLR